MSTLVTAAAVTAAALAAHAAYNVRLLRTPPVDAAPGFAPLVSVLVPARNEAETIAACVEACLRSRGVVLEVLVLDDGSTDGTAGVVEQIAARDRRVRLLHGAPLPDGWLGKPHACAQLAAAATGQTLAFVDADVVIEPDALVRSVALLEAAELDVVSPYPRQRAESPAERLVQPLLQWAWLTFLPLRMAETSPQPALTAANGQFLVCRRGAYDDAGGHAAVRGEVIEDVAFARAAKRAGRRVALADGTDIATCRMYDGWTQLRDGYSKSLWAVTGDPGGAVGVSVMLAWLYVLPPAVGAWRLLRRRRGVMIPAVGYAAGVAGRVVTARRTGGRTTDAAAHPVSVAVLIALQLRSVVLHRTGRLRWKGRRLP